MEEIEEAVLGAIMQDRNAYEGVIDLIKEDLFQVGRHKTIFNAISQLRNEGIGIDILTVTVKLNDLKELEFVGGPLAISNLTAKLLNTLNIEYHVRLLHERFIKKEVQIVGNDLILNSKEPNIDSLSLLVKAEERLNSINDLIVKGSHKSMSTVMDNIFIRNDKILQNQNGVSGVDTGFTVLNKFTGGWQDSDLIILAARPGMGKTSLALQLFSQPALSFNIPTFFASLEMSSEQLMSRVISQESGIPLENILRKGLQGHELEQAKYHKELIEQAPLYIDDTAGISLKEFEAKASRMKREKNIRLIVIDYLQLMTSGHRTNNGNEEIGKISQGLKKIAKNLDLPIICLSQLSRAVESRGGEKRPMLSDLRDSGSIEQDADMVLFLYRPEYYGITENEEGFSVECKAELIAAKHRNGGLGVIDLEFKPELTRFYG